jgi:ferredoxin
MADCSPPSTRERIEQRLVVNPVACDGVGICAHVAPDVVRVDSWGYPILPRRALTPAELKQARAAVTACPRRALLVHRST